MSDTIETEAAPTTAARYCAGPECVDCAPDDECCETVCGVCPRVGAAGGCTMQPGDVDGTRSCRQHGMYDMIRG